MYRAVAAGDAGTEHEDEDDENEEEGEGDKFISYADAA